MRRTSRHNGSAAVVVVVIVAILAIAGGAVWYFLIRSTPENAVATMLQAQAEGDQEKLKSVLTERSQQWASMAGGPMDTGAGGDGTPAYEIGVAQVDGERATVPVTYPLPAPMQQMSDTPDFTLNYVTHHEDGRWKVDLQDTIESMMGDLMSGAGEAEPPGGGGQ